MMTLIASWFQQSAPQADYRRTDYVLLWLILAAGVLLRFWGLGNVGLHGDEETMAMPAMAILETGEPHLPSGMYYARALLNIYMMSASAFLFGESEWAFRLPSAIVGSLTGLAAFFMGRRFLSPPLNLAFVATIVLLPAMIEVSQTARMYVFFFTCVIWFAACLFRWERDQRLSSLLLALVVWLLALHFHTLAIFAAPLFLFPGLSRQSWKQTIQGTVAFVAGGSIFNLYSSWISSKYPEHPEAPAATAEIAPQTPFELLLSDNGWLAVASMVVIAAGAIALILMAGRRVGWRQAVPAVLVALGLLAMAALQYHLGGLLLLFGVIFWVREPSLPRVWLISALVLAALIAVVHLGYLYSTGLYPGRQLIGAVIGMPSVWPTLRFLEYSPAAGAAYVLVLLVAFVRFSRGEKLPMHILFFVMAVWAPLLLLGFFTWYMPPRYAVGQLGYFLMCTFAGLAYLFRDARWMTSGSRLSRPGLAVLVLVVVALLNPLALVRTVNAGYESHPDHQGAAAFIKSLNLDDEAVLIAEDVLQQTYYLGEVDYSLRPIDNAVIFGFMRDGQLVDQYTGAPVIGTGAELNAVLDESRGKDLYIIGSGENFVRGERQFRTHGIEQVLESDRLKVVYEGRDGKTKVWKLIG